MLEFGQLVLSLIGLPLQKDSQFSVSPLLAYSYIV